MSMQAWLIVFAVWTVAGLLAAIALGHMVPRDERDERDEDMLAPAVPNVKHFRRIKRVAAIRQSSRNALRPDTGQRRTSTATSPHRKS